MMDCYSYRVYLGVKRSDGLKLNKTVDVLSAENLEK